MVINTEILDSIDPDYNMFFEHNFDNTVSDSNSLESCTYFSTQEYDKLYSTGCSNVSLINYNIRSFNKNGVIFESLLNSFSFMHDVVVLSETWNSPANPQLCKIPGYDAFHVCREGRSGGVSVLCRDTHDSRELSEFCEISINIEACVVRVDVGNFTINVVGVYRPHSGTAEGFTEALTAKLGRLPSADLTCVMGDFNLNLNDLSCNRVLNFATAMYSFHFLPKIDIPTRYSTSGNDVSGPSNLDQIWVNKLIEGSSGVINFDATDHCPSFIHLYCNLRSSPTTPSKSISFRPFGPEKLNALKRELGNTDWDSLLGINITDINYSTDVFMEFLNNAYIKHFPIKHKKISQKRIQNPWLTADIKNHLNVKSDFFKMYKEGSISKEINNRLRNKVNKIVLLAKENYYRNAFIRFKNDAKKKWQLIHDLCGTKNSKRNITSLRVGNNLVTSDQEIANEFNHFFNNIATDLDSELPLSQDSPDQFVKRNSNSFYFFPISPENCSVLIQRLKKTKCGIDEMPPSIFSSMSGILSYPVSILINASIECGKFPDVFKLARVTPVFKRGDKADPSNYRPISSLPYLSKIFERYVTNQITSFFSKFNIISKSQFGFQKGVSTADALIELTESIYQSLNNKSHHISILIDLKKAFDTMNHNILLNKLYLYGIRGLPLAWFRSYLGQRRSYVKLGESASDVLVSNIGIPQGSILGPILFLVFINDLPNVSNLFKTCLFADDTTLSVSNSNAVQLVETVNSDLNKISSWTLSNRLTINIDKTELLLFSNKDFDKNVHKLVLNNVPLRYVDSCKFLGVHIDHNMTFKVHIDHIAGKLSRGVGILYNIRRKLNIESRVEYYYAMLYPYLSYNSLIWASTFKTHLHPLIVQQKRIVRIIMDAGYRDPSDPLFKSLKILKVEDIFKFHVQVHIFKSRINHDHVATHNYNTRNADHLRPNFHRLSKTQHAMSCIGPKLWNELPSCLKNMDSLPKFKKSLKTYYIGQYNSDPG